MTENKEHIVDDEFDVSVDNAVKLVRKIEIYQWVEESRKNSDRTTYVYHKEWRSGLLNSNNFNDPSHENPSEMPFNDQTYLGREVHFGGYLLAES